MSNPNASSQKSKTFLLWVCTQLRMAARAHRWVVNSIHVTGTAVKEQEDRGKSLPFPKPVAIPAFPRDKKEA